MLVSIAGVFGGFMGVGSVGYGSVEGGVEAAIDGAQAEFLEWFLQPLYSIYTMSRNRGGRQHLHCRQGLPK
jgi:hypothetical protein